MKVIIIRRQSALSTDPAFGEHAHAHFELITAAIR
jgi:hypothetical protein